jgi:hypothetical protein
MTEAVLADTSVWEDWPFLQRFDHVCHALLRCGRELEAGSQKDASRVAAALQGTL